MVCALTLAITSTAASAQRVTGRIVDAPSRLGIAGAVLTQLDARGQALSRTLSGEEGRFTLVLDAEAMSVRVVRIGYHPRNLAVRDLGQEAIVMQRLPASLPPVRVAARGCPAGAASRPALALLDQARDGLLAAQVSREGKAISAVRLRFERDAEDDERASTQRVWLDSTADARTTFTSALPAAQLVERGFLEEREGGAVVMHAPDADVFLDDAFVNAYCFHIAAPSSARPTQVGLGFSPARDTQRRGRVDVEGTVWVDTARRELREVEFRYVGLPRTIATRHPGGQLTFLALANGLVLVDRWQLRLVGISLDTIAGFVARGVPVVRTRIHVRETGGEVASVAWPGNSFRAPLGALRVTVQTAQRTPAGGVALRLEGTDYRATTDGSGNASMDRLLPGPYKLVVLDPRLAPIDLALETGVRFDARRDSLHAAAFTLPIVPPAMQDYCERRRVRSGSPSDTIPWIIGRVRRTDGKFIAPGIVRAKKEVRTGWWEPAGEPFRVGTDGLFWICSAQLIEAASVQVEYQVNGGRVHRVQVPVQRTLTVVPLEIDP